jgi:hypothetical protein
MDQEPKPRAESEIDLDYEMIDETFLLKVDERRALEKKILSVAFLLEECSKGGNEPVDGVVAGGFAEVLRDAARDVARLRKELCRRDD